MMWRGPSADDAARAILAACKETEADPAAVMARDDDTPASRARHYALHALVHCFPRISGFAIAGLLCCPGRPLHFFKNSRHLIIGRMSDGERRAKWWSEAAYGRVIAAVEPFVLRDGYPDKPEGNSVKPALSIVKPVHRAAPSDPPLPPSCDKPIPPSAIPGQPAPLKMGPLPPAVRAKAPGRPTGGAIPRRPSGAVDGAELIRRVLEDDADDRPVFDGGRFAGRRDHVTYRPKNRREMDEDLRRAVLNTAAQQSGEG